MQQTFMHACMVVPCVASDACVESSSYIYGEYLASLSGTDGHARSAHQCVRDEQYSRPRPVHRHASRAAPWRLPRRFRRALASYTWGRVSIGIIFTRMRMRVRTCLVSTHPRAAGARGEPEPGEPCRVARRRRRRGRMCLPACCCCSTHACRCSARPVTHSIGTVAANVLSRLVALRTTVQCIH